MPVLYTRVSPSSLRQVEGRQNRLFAMGEEGEDQKGERQWDVVQYHTVNGAA
jgi:hypothetical protein